VHPVEKAAPCCPLDLLHVPRHGPSHPRSTRGGEDQEVMTVVAGPDGAEEQQREQSRRTRTLARRWTQARGPE
jgi:hypothetical protein